MVLNLLKPSLGGLQDVHEEGKKKKRTCQVPDKWQRQSHLLTAWKEGAL